MERPSTPAKSPGPQRRGKRLPRGTGTGSCPARRHGHSLEVFTNLHGPSPGFWGSLCKPQAPESNQERCILGRHLQTRSQGGRPVGGSRPLRDNFYRFPFRW